MTAGAALRWITRSCVEQIVGNEAAVLAGMPEGVHQMRVGVRRLRAILSAFAPLLKNDEFSWFSDELRWLGDVLGRARNLDVFVDGLVAPAIESVGDLPGITALHAAFAERRAAAYADAAEAIVSPRYTALMLRLMRWSEDAAAPPTSAAALSRPLAEVAPRLLKRRLKLVRRRSAEFSKQSLGTAAPASDRAEETALCDGNARSALRRREAAAAAGGETAAGETRRRERSAHVARSRGRTGANRGADEEAIAEGRSRGARLA